MLTTQAETETLDIGVTRVLGHRQDGHGRYTLVVEVQLGDTVCTTCELTLKTPEAVAALKTMLDEVVA